MHRQGLYRSRTDRVIGGVAGGIARSLNTDPAIVRLIFALMIIVGGGGLLLYVILWIALPEEPMGFFQQGTDGEAGVSGEPNTAQPSPMAPVIPPRRNSGALIAGLVMIIIGIVFLADRFLPNIHLRFHDFWPIIIVIAGLAIIFSSFTGTNKNKVQ